MIHPTIHCVRFWSMSSNCFSAGERYLSSEPNNPRNNFLPRLLPAAEPRLRIMLLKKASEELCRLLERVFAHAGVGWPYQCALHGHGDTLVLQS